MTRGLICFSSVGGTAGDLRPLAALALALRGRGFEVLVLGDGAYEATARRAGLAASEWFTYSQVPQTFLMRTTAGQRQLWGLRARSRDRELRAELGRHLQRRLAAFWQRLGSPANPRIVAAVGSISAWEMIGQFGPRCAKIVSCPMPYQPSRHVSLLPPDLSRAARLRDAFRQRFVPNEPLRRFCEERFHLVSASPVIFPRPDDWLPNMEVTGYVTLGAPADRWSPPARLAAFLRDGAPPIYAGFGSYPFFAGARGEQLARAIIDGCRRRGVRCVIQSRDLPRALEAPDVCLLGEDVPHEWLFPRCAAVLHHGGYGTLHTALAARRPSIVYPFQSDQFLWAARAGALGIGPGFTARLQAISAPRVAEDLGRVLLPECQARAAQLGAALAADRGLEIQVAAIESIIDHTRRGLRPIDWRMPADAWAAA